MNRSRLASLPVLLLFLTPDFLSSQALDPALLLKPPTEAWPTYNGDYSGRRFSPLSQINSSNIKSLNLAWVYRVNVGETSGAIVGGEGSPPKPNEGASPF